MVQADMEYLDRKKLHHKTRKDCFVSCDFVLIATTIPFIFYVRNLLRCRWFGFEIVEAAAMNSSSQ